MKYKLTLSLLCLLPISLVAAADNTQKEYTLVAPDAHHDDPTSYLYAYGSPAVKGYHFQKGALFFGSTSQHLAAWCIAGPREQSIQLFHRHLQNQAQFTTEDKKNILQSAFSHLKSSLTAEKLQDPHTLHLKVALILNCASKGIWRGTSSIIQAEFSNESSNFSTDGSGPEDRYLQYMSWQRADYIPLEILKHRHYDTADKEKNKQVAQLSNVIELIERRSFDKAANAYFNALNLLYKKRYKRDCPAVTGVLIVDLARLQAYRQLLPSQSLSIPELPAGCTVSCVLQ